MIINKIQNIFTLLLNIFLVIYEIMLKILYIWFLLFGILLFTSCEVDEQAKVVVTEKTTGYEQGGVIYIDVTLKNTGEQPAYFTVINVSALIDGNEMEYKEKAFGDIWPQEEKTERVKFNKLGGVMPDDFYIEIVFQNYMNNSILN